MFVLTILSTLVVATLVVFNWGSYLQPIFEPFCAGCKRLAEEAMKRALFSRQRRTTGDIEMQIGIPLDDLQ